MKKGSKILIGIVVAIVLFILAYQVAFSFFRQMDTDNMNPDDLPASSQTVETSTDTTTTQTK